MVPGYSVFGSLGVVRQKEPLIIKDPIDEASRIWYHIYSLC